ncbi:MAG: NAD-binding protein [Spirochaetales bacterium]|nr:NAD-binding protein [Spirochaetales bacterium]
MKNKQVLRRIEQRFASPFTQMAVFFLSVFIVTGFVVFILEYRSNTQFSDVFDGFWWAIITFSTTGYGDKVPVTPGGRIVAVVSIFMGIAAMSALSGSLASVFVDRNSRARRGLMDFPKLTNHLIICGWKDHMKDILLDIVRGSSVFTDRTIVIISNVDSERIEELKEQDDLSDIKFVRGDYFSESALNRANVQAAKKIIVIADTFETKAPSEIDAKTVMTVLTIKSMARDVYTCAEILDRKYESYLKSALCDEILFSRDFSRRILANSSITNGMSHIMQDLLSPDIGTTKITTADIPREFIGRPYRDYRDDVQGSANRILIGVLENTGSPNRMKLEALRDAQKTSDVSALVTNLQKVKGLEVNRPQFIPDDDYVLKQHSRAILLERIR